MILGARRNVAHIPAILIGLFWALFLGPTCGLCADQTTKILIFPFRVESETQTSALKSLSEHGYKKLNAAIEQLKDKCSVEPAHVAEKLLKGETSPKNEEEALEAALSAQVDMVIYGFLSEKDSTFRMKAVMWDVGSGRQAVSTELKVSNIHGLPELLDVFIAAVSKRLHGGPVLSFYRADPLSSLATTRPMRAPIRPEAPRNTGPWRSPEIATELWAVAVGDLDGDKRNEIVLLENGGINISRFEDGGLRQLAQFSRAPTRFFTADVADVDGDGVDELVTCGLTPTGVESVVIKYENRIFKVVDRVANVILRPIRGAGEGKRPILIGQKMDSEDIFTGQLVRYELRNGRLEPAGAFTAPPGTLVTSFAEGKMGKQGDRLRVILSQDQRLMVFDEENRLLYHEVDRLFGLERTVSVPSGQGRRLVAFPGRILIADTDGDGENELLVIKGSGGTASIHALTWDGAKLVEKWKSIGSRGVISDFTIEDFKNSGVRSLALILVESGPFPALSRPRSVVFAYDLVP